MMIKTNTTRAFSLIELMIVVSIIGILASIAVPGFQKYKNKAKYADAYVGVGAISKAQSIFFAENGTFSNLGSIGSYGLDGASGYIETGGNKFTIYAQADYGSGLVSRADLVALGSVVSHGSQSYFAYTSASGYWDDSGTGYGLYYAGGAPGLLQIDVDAFNSFKLSQTGDCATKFDREAIGISKVPGRHWAVILAGSDFIDDGDDPGICGFVLQMLIIDGTTHQGSPLITLNFGE